MICKEEFMRFCAFRIDDMKNMEEIVECLDRHLDELGQPCKNATVFAAKFIEDFHNGCDDDLKEFCPTLIGKPEQGKCVLENLPELKKDCLVMVQKSIYLMIRMKNAHGPHGPHDMIPPMTAMPLDVAFDTAVFFPGMLEEGGPEAADSDSDSDSEMLMWKMMDWDSDSDSDSDADSDASEAKWNKMTDAEKKKAMKQMYRKMAKDHVPGKMMFHAAFCGTVAAMFAIAAVVLVAKCICIHRRGGCRQGRCCQSASPITVVQGAVADPAAYKEFA